MSGRRGATNRIRGPQSALTDFLASHNISAAQISDEHQRRVREAQRQAAETAATATLTADEEENESDERNETPEERKKRKRKEERALAQIKQSKEFKKRKYQKKGEPDHDDDAIARDLLYSKSQPMPGQFENCEICEKRFTVTAYSKTGPDGGLLCAKCSKELADDKTKDKPKKRGPKKGDRRKTESNRLDGTIQLGAKSLLEACVEKVADNINDIEEFGDLPQQLLDRLSQILSKRRVITPRTLDLFLRPDIDKIAVYDCGRLETDDFRKIFTFMPNLKDVNLRFAGQMKDEIIEYMMEHNPQIRNLQLAAPNLVSKNCWKTLFKTRGLNLESLKLSELNDTLDDEMIKVLCTNAVNLRRLKLKRCSHLTNASLEAISSLRNLTDLSLLLQQDISAQTLPDLVAKVGRNLHTLSLERFAEADDTTIDAIRRSCHSLTKLRITDNAIIRDEAYEGLFSNWDNPPIPFIDLSGNRDIDNANPDGPEDTIGFASKGFKSMMAHSAAKLERLNISSCRHISREAFEEVFDGKKQYPRLRDLDVSFLTHVDDYLVGLLFKSCPALTKLAIFACFKVKDVLIPRGVSVLGLPNAQESVVTEGDFMGRL